MAKNSASVLQGYVRLLVWALVLYIVWCFGPAEYSSLRFRWMVSSCTSDAGVERQTPEQLEATLLNEGAVLGVPVHAEDMVVARDPVKQVISVSYFYVRPVSFFGKTLTLAFRGSSSASSYNHI
jgi:hypothetical protein